MERYHIYKLGLAILLYMVYCSRKAVVNSLEVDDVTSKSNTTDYRERRDSGDDNSFFPQAADGTPGVDYPTLSYVPRTKFSCRDMEAGYYADIETNCQVFHICDEGRKLSFLCPNGTIFQQGELICDWWFKVNCSTSPLLYEESAEILHRASAKRKESRRYQGTKQGVFSSKQDYDYKDYKDLSVHGTPSHFVTPSYPHKVSLKTFDNSISASTEGSIRRNYNIRGDRKLESIGNGVKESTSRFSSGINENTFSINLHGKSNGRSETTTRASVYEAGDHVNAFGGRKSEYNQQRTGGSAIGQTSFDRSSQQSSRGQNRFSTSFQEQGKSDGFGQTKVTAASRSTFGVNLQGKSDQFSQSTFNRGNQRAQNRFGSTLEGKATTPTPTSFGINLQGSPDRFGQTTFGAGIQREQKVFGSTLESETPVPTRSSFGGQFSFGRNNQIGTTKQLPLDRSAQRTLTNQGTFGTRLQDTVNGPKQTGFDINVQGKANDRKQISGSTTNREQFVVNTPTQQRFGSLNNDGFGTNAETQLRGKEQSISATNIQANDFQLSTLGKKTEETKPNTRTEDDRGKVKFSISQGHQSDSFAQRSFNVDKHEKIFEDRQVLPVAHTQDSKSGATYNRFDVGLNNKFEGHEQTTNRAGSNFNEKSYTTEAGRLYASTSSAETQEPQETASFVKNFRNNIADNNAKQRTTSFYPNHRDTYSEIKDPRHYHERPQSKLPDKPFYGSSIGPQVLSTVPLSAQSGSFSSTTESSSRFGFNNDVSTVKAVLDTTSRKQFPTFKLGESKTSTTSNRFGDVRPTQQTHFGFKQNNKQFISGVDVSPNSVSSTLQPEFEGESKRKSTVFSSSQKNYFGSKLSGVSGIIGRETSTPAVGISTYSYTKVPTTEKVHTDSPIIKLNIIPSTALPGFAPGDRTGKAFSIESPKTQIIQNYKTGFTKIPRREYDGSTLPVNVHSKNQGFISTTAANLFISSNPTLSSNYLEGKSEGNAFGAVTTNGLTPSVAFNRFGSVSISSTPNPLRVTNEARFTINQENYNTKPSKDGGLVNLNINKQSYAIPTTENINIKTELTSTVPDESTTTSTLGTGQDGLEFTINDQIYSTPSSESTETVDITINGQRYSTPSSQFTVTGRTEFGITATTATPFEDQTTQNVLYTSPSSVLQPKPFSFPTKAPSVIWNSVTPTVRPLFGVTLSDRNGLPEVSGTTKDSKLPQLPPYKLSSASPFAPVSQQNNNFGSNTPIPTFPTPFTTVATLLHRTKPIDENVSNMINTLIEAARQRFSSNDTDNGFGTPRPGLVVPPSAGPQTLHTLAIYFANALDNLTASAPREQAEHVDDETETDSPIIQIDNDEFIKSLLTQMTLDKYEGLFKEKTQTTTETTLSVRAETDDSENDLIREDTKHAAEGPPVRQLARVFTEALSAYLDDPDTFKKVLHEVRPTEPPLTTTEGENIETEEDEVLNYSDSDLKSDHPHLPTRPTGIPISPTWGYILTLNKSLSSPDNLESRNSLNSDNENLQSADSQSFVSQFNKVTKESKPTPSTSAYKCGESVQTTTESYPTNEEPNALSTLPEDHWTASKDVAKLWQTTLSVNPATLNENFDATKGDQDVVNTISTQLSGVTSSDESSSEATGLTTVSEIQYELRALPKLELNSTQVHGILIDFMNATKTEGSAKLQRVLHKLNISQDEFLDKMKEIEGNPLTRRLILLLISECNTDKNKELDTAASDGIFGAKVNTENVQSRIAESQDDHAYTDPVGEVTESNLFKQIVHPSLEDGDEDTRALELLNSLYVIASKFGK